ncbi:MAG: DUF433 domain-containing protein [Arcanobacterium sp.]|nr:DUF433 domain-containing protein [Arcanobacterium sp.]
MNTETGMEFQINSRGLYQPSEVDRIMRFPRNTTAYWAAPYKGDAPIISRLERPGRYPSIPFIGLAEASVLQGFKATGVNMRRIRPAFTMLRERLGIEHVLLSDRLYTDGAEILYEYAEHKDGEALKLVVARNGQQVLTTLIEQYLKRITFDKDASTPVRISLEAIYGGVDVFVDPFINSGAPTLQANGMRVQDILGYIRAGDTVEDIAEEFGLTPKIVRDLILAA